jgi:hypothetical protein
MLARKQCVGASRQNSRRGLLVLQYNYLHCCWYLRKAVPESILDAWVNLLITLPVLALLQCGQRGIFAAFALAASYTPDELAEASR